MPNPGSIYGDAALSYGDAATRRHGDTATPRLLAQWNAAKQTATFTVNGRRIPAAAVVKALAMLVVVLTAVVVWSFVGSSPNADATTATSLGAQFPEENDPNPPPEPIKPVPNYGAVSPAQSPPTEKPALDPVVSTPSPPTPAPATAKPPKTTPAGGQDIQKPTTAAHAGELTAFDCRGECALDQRIDDAVLRTDIVGLRAVTADGASHSWALAGTTLEALLHQDWHGVAGEDDRFKLLAGGADIHQSLYMFDDGDAVNYAGDAACPAASMAGQRQEDCPGTPVGLISMHNPARDDLTGDYGACDLRTDWGFLVAALFVEPSGRPPPPPPPPSALEEVAFDNRGQCNVAQVVPAALLAKPIRSIRVERVDGGTASWDVLTFEGTLGEMLDVGHWHGVAGETDQFKLLAGESSHPNQNLYVFNDNDAANYDADGCAAAAMPFGTPQISGCAGTPHGLFSMGHHQTDLAGDYGECNYRGDWGWVVKAMWLTPA